MEIQDKIQIMLGKDHKAACAICDEFAKMSETKDELYSYMNQFIEMLENKNSYVRNRGLQLIAANSRWDSENKLDEVIDSYLMHVDDLKPITSRQCIKFLPQIAANKPELREPILARLRTANPSRYAQSMQTLVAQDIAQAIDIITKMEEKNEKK